MRGEHARWRIRGCGHSHIPPTLSDILCGLHAERCGGVISCDLHQSRRRRDEEGGNGPVVQLKAGYLDQIGKQFCPFLSVARITLIYRAGVVHRSTLDPSATAASMCRKIVHSSTFKRRLKLITAVNLDDKPFSNHNYHNDPHIYT